jgi:hypothetical protein
LASSRCTGILSVTFRDRRAFVVLEKGLIVGASSARLPSRLKPVRATDPEAAEEELLSRVCEVIQRAMAWPKGHFSFSTSHDIAPEPGEEERPRLHPERVLMETALALDQERRVG